MNIPSKECVIEELQNHFGAVLLKYKNKQVFYSGKLKDNKEIIVFTPHSKLHINGHGWIDINEKQTSILEKTECSIMALRLEGDKVYYFKFHEFKPYLTKEAMTNEDHWKIYIYSDYLQMRQTNKKFSIKANDLGEIMI